MILRKENKRNSDKSYFKKLVSLDFQYRFLIYIYFLNIFPYSNFFLLFCLRDQFCGHYKSMCFQLVFGFVKVYKDAFAMQIKELFE